MTVALLTTPLHLGSRLCERAGRELRESGGAAARQPKKCEYFIEGRQRRQPKYATRRPNSSATKGSYPGGEDLNTGEPCKRAEPNGQVPVRRLSGLGIREGFLRGVNENLIFVLPEKTKKGCVNRSCENEAPRNTGSIFA